MSLENVFTRAWQQQSAWLWGLAPLSWLYGGLFKLNKLSHDCGIKAVYHAPVPVIVIGNISVGGSGKTPFIIALVEQLHKLNLSVGVISRGYGGQADKMPLLVTADSSPDVVGDEPALIVRQTGVAMAVCPNRQQAIELLIEHHPDIQLILSDDGLQHHALHRDAEWIVVDAVRGFGNQRLLPMGYLREPVSRLVANVGTANNTNAKNVKNMKPELLFNITGLIDKCHYKSINADKNSLSRAEANDKLRQHLTQLAPNLHTLAYLAEQEDVNKQSNLNKQDDLTDIPTMNLRADSIISLSAWARLSGQSDTADTSNQLNKEPKDTLSAQAVIAMTGIGYPQRFFNSLSELGFVVTPVAMPDHYHYNMADLERLDELSTSNPQMQPHTQAQPHTQTDASSCLPIVVTAKDAVKIVTLLEDQNSPTERQGAAHWYQRIWVLPVTAELSDAVYQRLHRQLQTLAIL